MAFAFIAIDMCGAQLNTKLRWLSGLEHLGDNLHL